MGSLADAQRRRGWVALALSVATASRAGLGAEPTRAELAVARDLFSGAERDEEASRWVDALDKLRRTGSIKMTPGIRFHIALCEDKLGKLVAALGDYVAAENSAREEGNKDVLDAVAEPLAGVRARVPTITLRLPEGARDAEISLDGALLPNGSLGAPLPVDVGSHAVAGRAANRARFSATVSVVEKQALSVDVLLPSVPSAATASHPLPVDISEGARLRAPRAGAVVASTGALALVGFGVAAFFVAGSKQSSAEAQCMGLSSCDGLRAPVRTWDALALTGWIAGAGAGVLAVYLWTRPGIHPPGGATLRLSPDSIQIVGRF